MYNQIIEVLEMGLKDDGKSFYSEEEKAEILYKMFIEENKKSFNRGWVLCYEIGARDTKPSFGW